MHIWNLPWLPSPNNSLLVHNVCNRIWFLMSILSHQRTLFKSGGLWKPTWIDMRNLIRKARWIEIFNFQMYENLPSGVCSKIFLWHDVCHGWLIVIAVCMCYERVEIFGPWSSPVRNLWWKQHIFLQWLDFPFS